MSKPTEIIHYCNAVCPNVFDKVILYKWLNEVEGQVQTEIARIAVDSTAFIVHDPAGYEVKNSAGNLTEGDMYVLPPHDKLYGEYVCARICEAEGEIARANNYMTRFNDFYQEFSRWFVRNYNPSKVGR